MTEQHLPVMVEEIMTEVPPEAERIIDATLGQGGHTRALLNKAPRAQILGLDRDEESLKETLRELVSFRDRLNVVLADFRDIDWAAHEIGWSKADIILFDLGISSRQLNDPAYGLSFQRAGPLDMRLDKTQVLTAGEIINTWREEKLEKLFRETGEDPFARRLARVIIESRQKKPLRTTTDLADLIERSVPVTFRYRKIHPATNIFRALRMEVNDELGALAEALPKASRLLGTNGKLMVISFHSLEDRLVKNFIRGEATLKAVTKKPVTPKEEERRRNPRARSAKLRIALKST